MTSGYMVFWYAGVALLTLHLLLPKSRDKPKSFSLSKAFGYETLRKEAEGAGWNLSSKEFLWIIGLAGALIALIALFTGNYFFIALGLALCFTLPRYIILKVKRNKRTQLLFELPSNLRLWISKMGDFGHVQKALESALPDMEGSTKSMFQVACDKLRIGLPLQRVLEELYAEIRIRKLEDFGVKLLMAQMEGFHRRSLDSLKETVEQISEDIAQVKELEIEAKSKRRQLVIIVAMSWMMPILLSSLSSNNGNLFLDTWYGQIFIVSFATASLFAVGKGDDFLSLNLDEL
ncbi:type II secretion system F family protein [Paenibacillus sonchi]|uniref:Type II secretion system F family protein n=1 Tax=Paenibacillus sonchi TaxID=373687 RepID=A0A974SAK3_9BACL|nr:type II secretion system F family protein [Paenibacillus sonchi]QQZ58872.1 type II secretion system F family protein [Paenibacillus sonchi]